jgi:hypothetical protein
MVNWKPKEGVTTARDERERERERERKGWPPLPTKPQRELTLFLGTRHTTTFHATSKAKGPPLD